MRQRAENRAALTHTSPHVPAERTVTGLRRPGSAGGWVTATVRSPSGVTAVSTGAQFEVQSLTRSGKSVMKLSVCRSTGMLDVYDVRRQTHESMNVREIMKVRKSEVDDRKLKLFCRHVTNPEKYLFASKAHRDRFYRLVLCARFPPRSPVALGSGAGAATPAAGSSSPSSLTTTRVRAGTNPLASRGHSTVLEPAVGEQYPISVFVGTWNVGNAAPADLSPWLEPGHDIYAVSVQECEYAPRTGYSNCESDVFAAIQGAIGPGYVQLEGLSLLYIRLIVLVRREHYYRITNLHKGKEATGIANIIGNKGGVAVAFNFNETRLCFVGCHLAAHLEKVVDRNANYSDMVRGLRLPKEMDLLNYYDHLFWCGDLNYRLDMSREEAIALIEKEDWAALRKHDQLIEEMREKRCFVGFREGEVNFRPTYRYNRGDRTYSEEKMRIPSWCDRVLWKSLDHTRVTLQAYECCDQVMTSDHSPVRAVFRVHTAMPTIPGPEKPCVIRLSSMYASDLRTGAKGPPSPYLWVWSDCLESYKTSSAVMLTTSPVWPEEAINDLKPIICEEDYLRTQKLFIQIKCHSSRDVLGQAVLPLHESFAPNSHPLRVELTHRGLSRGTFSCRVEVLSQSRKRASQYGGMLHQGYLLKRGEKIKNWKRRWFKLTSDGKLEYSTAMGEKPIDSVLVLNATVREDSSTGKENGFAIETRKRTYHLLADNQHDLHAWLDHLGRVSLTGTTSEPSAAVAAAPSSATTTTATVPQ